MITKAAVGVNKSNGIPAEQAKTRMKSPISEPKNAKKRS